MTRLLTLREVAAALRVSPRTIQRRVAAGAFPSPIRFDGARSALWREVDLERYVAAHRALPRGLTGTHPIRSSGTRVPPGSRLWDD